MESPPGITPIAIDRGGLAKDEKIEAGHRRKEPSINSGYFSHPYPL
ncbi:MAG: hypothetical protein ACLPVI_01000 [Dehalococcoidales bacterium]